MSFISITNKFYFDIQNTTKEQAQFPPLSQVRSCFFPRGRGRGGRGGGEGRGGGGEERGLIFRRAAGIANRKNLL